MRSRGSHDVHDRDAVLTVSGSRSRSPSRAGCWALALALSAVSAPSLTSAQTAAPAPRLTRPPRLRTFVDAPYPESERAAGRAATVVLRLTITPTGSVEEAVVAESAGAAFDAAAVTAARRFEFDPAEVDGRPAPVRILYRYRFVLRVEQRTDSEFTGIVRTRGGRRPVEGVTVSVEGAGAASTDATGRFTFASVSAGRHAVLLRGPRLTEVRTAENFEAGRRVEALYEVTLSDPADAQRGGDDLEIVVTAPPLRRQVVSTEVGADQARRVPGTQGDVLRVVENMPGVARASAGSGALVVWGAAPEDTRVYVDGVPVPRLYHDGGLRSILPGDAVQSVELVPGAYGPQYGRGLGGLVNVTTRAWDEAGTHGSLALDVIDASVSARTTAGPLRAGLSVRRSHLADVLSVASQDLGDYFPVPRYYDAQVRLAYVPSTTERVELTGLLSSDRIARTRPSPDPQLRASDARGLDFYRLSLRYRRTLGAGSEVSVTPWVGVDRRTLEQDTGGVRVSLATSSVLGGVRANWRGRVAPWLLLEAGLDAELNSTSARREGSLAAPAREGDVRTFGQPLPSQRSADRWEAAAVSLAPFAEADVSLLRGKLHVVPGLRVDPYARSVSRRTPIEGDTPRVGAFSQDFRVEPRVSVRYVPHPRVTLRAGYGRYHQQPSPEDLSASFGNPLLAVSRADHALVGAAFRLTDTLSVELTGFFSSSAGLAVRNPDASPLRAQALVGTGEGRAFGGQVLVRQELFHHFFGWVSYSLLRSERRADTTSPWRLFDYDQTHVLTVLASYELPLGLEVGLRARVASGFPRTPVTGSYYDSTRDLYEPQLGAVNSSRLPVFFQLDARVAKRFRLGSTTLDAYLEVQNVSNQANAEEVVYSYDYSRSAFITGLPIIPVLGARWTF